jgi:signal peptidase I
VTPGKAVAFGILGLCLGIAAFALLIVAATVLSGVMHLNRIPSGAMEPALDSGDRVLSLKYLFFHPGRSDIVAFHAPARAAQVCGTGGVYVERIVGLPGETWQEQKGRVYIDKQLLVETYVQPSRRDHLTHAPVNIPQGSYFVMGDDRTSSCDSRRWGVLPRSAVIGRVIATYWPLSRIAPH